MDKIIGVVSPVYSITGEVDLTASNHVIGVLNVSDAVHDKYPDYTGSYLVTPKITEQVLSTEGKSMNNDIFIEKIPYQEVINQSGGRTVVIGFE